MCTELNIIRWVLRIEPTSSLFTQPAKRTYEFSNQPWVFIRPTCLTLSQSQKFEATLTQYSLHQCRHQPFQKFAKIFADLQLKIFKPRGFYSIKIFAIQPMSQRSCYMYMDVYSFVYSSQHWAYLFTRTHTVNSVCEKVYSIWCLFYFQCSTVNIYKYKGKSLPRIPHAFHASFSPFAFSNKQALIQWEYYRLHYGALHFSFTQVSPWGQSMLLLTALCSQYFSLQIFKMLHYHSCLNIFWQFSMEGIWPQNKFHFSLAILLLPVLMPFHSRSIM